MKSEQYSNVCERCGDFWADYRSGPRCLKCRASKPHGILNRVRVLAGASSVVFIMAFTITAVVSLKSGLGFARSLSDGFFVLLGPVNSFISALNSSGDGGADLMFISLHIILLLSSVFFPDSPVAQMATILGTIFWVSVGFLYVSHGVSF